MGTCQRSRPRDSSLLLATVLVAILGSPRLYGVVWATAESPSEQPQGKANANLVTAPWELAGTPPAIERRGVRSQDSRPQPGKIEPYGRDASIPAPNVHKRGDFASTKDARGEQTVADWDSGCWVVLAICAVLGFVIAAIIKGVRSKCPACGRHGLCETGEVKRQGWFRPKLEECKCRYCGHTSWRDELDAPFD
jgi:hypothetical protein